MAKSDIEKGRKFLMSEHWDDWDKIETDQRKEKPFPAVQNSYPSEADQQASASISGRDSSLNTRYI